MKSLTTSIAAILLISAVSNSQTSRPKPDQVELMKKFIGTWTCTTGKDTTALWEFTPFGTGLECHVSYVTDAKVFGEMKALYGYDRQYDKYIAPGMVKGKDMEIFAIWFTGEKSYEIIFFRDISDPDSATVRNLGSFESPDTLLVTTFVNKKPVRTLSYSRNR
jgi:hypothetical protein